MENNKKTIIAISVFVLLLLLALVGYFVVSQTQTTDSLLSPTPTVGVFEDTQFDEEFPQDEETTMETTLTPSPTVISILSPTKIPLSPTPTTSSGGFAPNPTNTPTPTGFPLSN